jgi:hypothetical protein
MALLCVKRMKPGNIQRCIENELKEDTYAQAIFQPLNPHHHSAFGGMRCQCKCSSRSSQGTEGD